MAKRITAKSAQDSEVYGCISASTADTQSLKRTRQLDYARFELVRDNRTLQLGWKKSLKRCDFTLLFYLTTGVKVHSAAAALVNRALTSQYYRASVLLRLERWSILRHSVGFTVEV